MSTRKSTKSEVSEVSTVSPAQVDLSTLTAEQLRAVLMQKEREESEKADAEARATVASIMEQVKGLSPLARAYFFAEDGVDTLRPVADNSRTRITEETRAAIVADLNAGELTTNQIAQRHGVSPASVSLIKRKAGLTKPHAS